jgi:3-hydroxyacyl-[acyl-carrier-protein] dehydratase
MPHDPVSLGLPHREPFLFVERITSLTPGCEASGEKVFHASDPIFRGHFPGNPLVPGVILTEALAQIAGIAGAGTNGRSFLLSAIRSMKFPAAAHPDRTITLHARKIADLGGLVQFEVKATVEATTVATGILVLNDVTP